MNYIHRDVELIDLLNGETLVTACDSCGGIGLKEHDEVKAPNAIIGVYTARVCLMEVLTINAKPVGVAVNICNEPEPTGSEIINGIRNEINDIGMELPITVSTEKNIKTSMTALGVTVYGIGKKEEFFIGKIKPGDYIYTIGKPCVGYEVLENSDVICRTKDIIRYLNNNGVSEIIPVGSSGVKGELDKLKKELNLDIKYEENIDLDLEKSAGPCTVSIIIAGDRLNTKDSKITYIGKVAGL